MQLDIEEKVRLAKDTEVKISAAREVYRLVAARGSLMYFLIDNINTLDRVYHYSMANYVYILRKGMDVTPGGIDQSRVPPDLRTEEPLPIEQRVKRLIETTSYETFQYVAQGLFERHKLIVATQLCIAILRQEGKLQGTKLDFLLKGPRAQGQDNPLREFVTDSVWACVMALRELDDYATLPDDLQVSAACCSASTIMHGLLCTLAFCHCGRPERSTTSRSVLFYHRHFSLLLPCQRHALCSG
jgi:dynein heavy chain